MTFHADGLAVMSMAVKGTRHCTSTDRTMSFTSAAVVHRTADPCCAIGFITASSEIVTMARYDRVSAYAQI
jgi:hypothetical protein